MAKGTIVQKATAIAEPIAESLGLGLWDIRYEKEGASMFLRFFIDKEEGITFDDCEAFSRAIDPILDEEDFIEDSYYLEVSSPGIDRSLKRDSHFESSVGLKVLVETIRPDDAGRRSFEGVLKEFKDKVLSIDLGSEIVNLELSKISKAKRIDDIKEGF